MKSCVEYLQARPNRWVTIEMCQDANRPNVTWHPFEGWLRGADEIGVVIFGKPVADPFAGQLLTDFKEDSHLFTWDHIQSIHFDQDREE